MRLKGSEAMLIVCSYTFRINERSSILTYILGFQEFLLILIAFVIKVLFCLHLNVKIGLSQWLYVSQIVFKIFCEESQTISNMKSCGKLQCVLGLNIGVQCPNWRAIVLRLLVTFVKCKVSLGKTKTSWRMARKFSSVDTGSWDVRAIF